ncbi:MAG: nucleoid-associated protein, partial [Aeromonas sp.]
MSLDIDKIILHSLRQDAEGKPQADTRNQLLAHDEAVQGLMAEIHRLYNGKGGKGFGYFAEAGDEGESPLNPRFREA